MIKPQHIAVLDVGKTNVKVVLFDVKSRKELAVRKQPNHVQNSDPYPHYDVEIMWNFFLKSLLELHSLHRIDALTVATHGATIVLVNKDGGLALPILDYEHSGPDETRSEYAKLRPDFSETGSPSLPIGLNVGAQLFWQMKCFPQEFANTASIMTYAQYWSFRLSGVRSNEVSSLGSHTDLWAPEKKQYSTLVAKLGWTDLMAPLRAANDCLGPITPDLADKTGLPPTCPVYCGIHDSNASLLPHLLSREKPFAVVSTGTWVIVMAIGGTAVQLDPAREMLFNVSADCNPVPTSRFMGGREYELLMQGDNNPHYSQSDVDEVENKGVSFVPNTNYASLPNTEGHFKNRAGEILDPLNAAQRHVAVSYHLAKNTAKCLSLIGAVGPIIVEGPFAKNKLYLSKLQALTSRSVEAAEGTGTSLGAALLTT